MEKEKEQSLNCSTNKKSEWKKNLKIAVAMLLVAAISIGGTLAYLSKETGNKENTFTGSAGIDLTLTEPDWEENPASDTGLDTNDPSLNTTLTKEGEKLAEDYTPDMEIPKDPTVKNTSDSGSEWIAIRVDYTFDVDDSNNKLECNKEQIDDILTFQRLNDDGTTYSDGIDTSKWIKITTTTNGTDATKYDIYLYSVPLTAGTSVSLFDRVVIKDQNTLQTKGIYNSTTKKYKDFTIKVSAGAIKNDKSLSTYISTIASGNLKSLNVANIANATSDALPASGATNEESLKLNHYAQEIEIALVKLLITD